MDERPDLAETLSRAVARISVPETLDETLDAIVTVARESLLEIDHVGITMAHADGRLVTAAATGEFVHVLDKIQYDAGDGPCVSALRDEPATVCVVEHARHDGRWHEFMVPAVQLGLRAQLAAQMFAGHKTVGVLNLYSTSSETISLETRHLADLFATHAALAYGHVRTRINLYNAMQSRGLIGQAIGITMARYDVESARAFEYLVRLSTRDERKLRDVAQDIVDEAERRNSGRA